MRYLNFSTTPLWSPLPTGELMARSKFTPSAFREEADKVSVVVPYFGKG